MIRCSGAYPSGSSGGGGDAALERSAGECDHIDASTAPDHVEVDSTLKNSTID